MSRKNATCFGGRGRLLVHLPTQSNQLSEYEDIDRQTKKRTINNLLSLSIQYSTMDLSKKQSSLIQQMQKYFQIFSTTPPGSFFFAPMACKPRPQSRFLTWQFSNFFRLFSLLNCGDCNVELAFMEPCQNTDISRFLGEPSI